MAGSVERLQPQPPDQQQFLALQAQVDKRRRAGAVHHHRYTELAPELLGCRKMIRVSVRVDEIADTQPIARGQREVTIDLAELRVDQHRGTGCLAVNQIGAAAARSHCFEYHPLLRKPQRGGSLSVEYARTMACGTSSIVHASILP